MLLIYRSHIIVTLIIVSCSLMFCLLVQWTSVCLRYHHVLQRLITKADRYPHFPAARRGQCRCSETPHTHTHTHDSGSDVSSSLGICRLLLGIWCAVSLPPSGPDGVTRDTCVSSAARACGTWPEAVANGWTVPPIDLIGHR